MDRADQGGQIDPQVALALERSRALLPEGLPVHRLTLAEARRLYAHERRFWNRDAPVLDAVRDLTIPGPHGDIPLRVFHPTPERPTAAVVYLHGGGWILGGLDTHDRIMRLLARQSGLAVVGVDYRLAPEFKFPVQHDEALATLDYLATAGADLGLDPTRLLLAGDSAGATLALGVCLARKRLLRGAVLVYGGYGLADSPSRRAFGGNDDGLGRAELDYYRACLVRGPDDLRDPRLAPLDTDLADLPPIFVAAAERDPLRDDSLALAKRLADTGVDHAFRLYPGVPHGFLHLSLMVDRAGQAINDAAAWLRAHGDSGGAERG